MLRFFRPQKFCIYVLVTSVQSLFIGTTLNLWFSPPCFAKAKMFVQLSLLAASTSRTVPKPLVIVKSCSKVHFWLSPPWGDHRITFAPSSLLATSRTRLEKRKKKVVKIFPTLMIRNILKWRDESDTYLTPICRHHWSRKSPMKIEEITGAFSQHCGFHQL